eukprot:1187977-Prorocentrum_minimum.AAC.3
MEYSDKKNSSNLHVNTVEIVIADIRRSGSVKEYFVLKASVRQSHLPKSHLPQAHLPQLHLPQLHLLLLTGVRGLCDRLRTPAAPERANTSIDTLSLDLSDLFLISF